MGEAMGDTHVSPHRGRGARGRRDAARPLLFRGPRPGRTGRGEMAAVWCPTSCGGAAAA